MARSKGKSNDGYTTVSKGKPEQMVEGQVEVGIYRGLEPKQGQSSAVLRLEQDGQVTRFWAPAILANTCAELNEGDNVRITCEGKSVAIKSRGGQKAWAFKVERKES